MAEKKATKESENSRLHESSPTLSAGLIALSIDAACLFAFYTYYGIITPYFERNLSAWQSVASSSVLNQGTILLFVALGFWIIPASIYSIFKALKIPVLATGHVGAMPGMGRFLRLNLTLAGMGFISYALFEFLGGTLQEAVTPFAAGGFLLVSLTSLGLLACISHSLHWKGERKPLKGSFSHATLWKSSLPYLGISIVALILLNIAAYLILQRYLIEGLSNTFAVISALTFLWVMNRYQSGLYRLIAPKLP